MQALGPSETNENLEAGALLYKTVHRPGPWTCRRPLHEQSVIRPPHTLYPFDRLPKPIMAAIVVQPPTQTPANTQLYPPVVAWICGDNIEGGEASNYANVFAMAALLDHNDNPVQNQLGGTTVVSAMVVRDASDGSSAAGSSSQASTSLYFVFPDLHITWAGTYTIKVGVYSVDYASANGAQFLGSGDTGPISVYDDDVAIERPSECVWLYVVLTLAD